MDRAKGIAKNGYHPTGKDGERESWRGNHKGINQVAKMVGKGKTNDFRSAMDHTSRPLSSLKDPDSFGPPPKNLNYHGSPTTSSPTSAVSPSRRAIDSPISTDNAHTPYGQTQTREETTQKPAPPALPYRANRTGINTSNLPAPPVRRTGSGSGSASSPSSTPASLKKPPKPNLPPRLPPRQNSTPLQSEPIDPPPSYAAATEEQREWSQQKQPPMPPPRHNAFANQEGAIQRLGSAGVKVPGLGIGKTSSSPAEESENPWADEPSGASRTDASKTGSIRGLSSRFSNLSTTASSSPAPASAPSKGTTWAEKQAALKTASSLRNDPSSVSLSDAKATATTAANFHERHGHQVAQGLKVGNDLNKKYGLMDEASTSTGSPTTGQASPSPGGGIGSSETQANPWAGVVGKSTGINRKPPPPPVPLGSKPR